MACARCNARRIRELHNQINKLSFRAEVAQVWLAYVCLLRYSEANEAVRKFMEASSFDSDDDSSDWQSCVSEDESHTTASGFDSASEGWCESDAWDADIDSDVPYACPVEDHKQERPAWLGTRQQKPGRKVTFTRGHRAVCEESKAIDYCLVDGTWNREGRSEAMVNSLARAIARARQQRCEVVSELPASERVPLNEEHPTILVHQGGDVLILDARCSWSNPGYEPHSVHWKDTIPKYGGNLPEKIEQRSLAFDHRLVPACRARDHGPPTKSSCPATDDCSPMAGPSLGSATHCLVDEAESPDEDASDQSDIMDSLWLAPDPLSSDTESEAEAPAQATPARVC